MNLAVLDRCKISEPRWRDWVHLRRTNIPIVKQWLLDRGSLTKHVKKTCPGEFRVKMLYQDFDCPWFSERRLLKLPRGAKVLIREVNLCCSGDGWVFARTLIPLDTMLGTGRQLENLGERPLGAVLFANPAVQRYTVEIARLLPQHILFRKACCIDLPPSILWGRRTLFLLNTKPLLVNEIFLPEIPVQYGPRS